MNDASVAKRDLGSNGLHYRRDVLRSEWQDPEIPLRLKR